MKHGCTVMTLRLSIGSSQIHHSRKKCVKFAAMSSPCWSFFWHPRHCPQGIRTPWSNRQWQVLLWGFEAAQMSRQVEEKQLVSPPWQRTHSHITCCSTIPDFQKHYSDSPPPLFAWHHPLQLFPIPQDEITAERVLFWHDWGYQHTFENFQGCMKSWETCWDHRIHPQRDYSKGDGGNFFWGVRLPEFLGSPTISWHTKSWITVSWFCTNYIHTLPGFQVTQFSC